MASRGWTRREVIGGLALVVAAALSRAASGAGADRPGPPGAGDREARRRWALARMDEMAQERLRCRERFKQPRQVRDCEADFERRHRAYNEVYLEAARD